MAEIKIYGTLVNDTAEPIAYIDQIYNRAGTKNLETIIDDKISAIKFPEYELPEATSDTLGGIRLGKYLKEDPNNRGHITVDTALDSLPGVISETRVTSLANTAIYEAVLAFCGEGEPKEEGEEDKYPELRPLLQFGTWIFTTPGSFEAFEAKMSEDVEAIAEAKVKQAVDALVDGAPAAYDTLKEIGSWISTHEGAYDLLNKAVTGKADKATTLAGYGITDASISADGTITLGAKSIKPITQHQSLASYATKPELNTLGQRVTAIEQEACMTEEEAEAMVREIFGN